eukprot:8380965-Pyramimonas_sp.AAC.1
MARLRSPGHVGGQSETMESEVLPGSVSPGRKNSRRAAARAAGEADAHPRGHRLRGWAGSSHSIPQTMPRRSR